MHISILEIWFDKNEDRLETLVQDTGFTSMMQHHLENAGFPATEMNELRATLKRAEELLLDLKQSVLTRARGE